nr:hypothetical protein [Tanacetum cinerariifolium]
MASLTFADTHNMIAFLSKSNASAGFDQIVDFLSAQVIQYTLMVNPTIYVSCIKQFWATVSIKKANDVVKLQALIDRKKVVIIEDVIRQDLRLDDADGVECLPNEEIFAELARMGYEKPPPKLTFYKDFFSAYWKFLIHTLVQFMIHNQVDDLSSHTIKYTSHALTQKVFANMRRIGKGFSRVENPLFASMMEEVYVTQPPRFKDLDHPESLQGGQVTIWTALSSKSMPAKDVEEPQKKRVAKETLLQESFKKLKAVEFSGSESTHDTPTNDLKEISEEDVKTMLEIVPVSEFKVEALQVKEKQEKDDLEKDKVLQQQYDGKQENIDWNVVAKQIQEKHLDNIKKYQSLKRKPVSIAQARKNMIIYLKNIVRYKMEHFRGMTYDKIHYEGSRSYWKIIRVGGITEAYQSFEDILKGFNREDLDALWRLVKEKFSLAMPT